MRNIGRLALFTGLMLITACASRAGGARAGAGRGGLRQWEILGVQTVTDRLDHDRIPVSGAQGDFTAIKIAVERAPVDFARVVVHYRTGGDQVIDIRGSIRAGGETRTIDLRGGDRVIRDVEFWYDARTLAGRQAVVRLLGHK